MACGICYGERKNQSCVSEKSGYEAELAANNAAIAEYNKVINAFNNGILDNLTSCETAINCATEKAISSLKGYGVDQSMADYKTSFLQYSSYLQNQYKQALANRTDLQSKNIILKASIAQCGDCMETYEYPCGCDREPE